MEEIINNNNTGSSTAADRKFIERNRRNQMKALYCKLNSLVPHHTSREGISLPDQLEEATNYIKRLQMNIERMKDKKKTLLGIERPNNNGSMRMRVNNDGGSNDFGLRSPQIEVQQIGLALEVVLVTGLDCQFMFNEAIRVLHEEGADIISASYKAVEDGVFHTIHSKVEGSGNVAARVSERLRKLMYDDSSYSPF